MSGEGAVPHPPRPPSQAGAAPTAPAEHLPAWAALFRDESRRPFRTRDVPGSGPLPAPPPSIVISESFYRQTGPRRRALDVTDEAPAAGRYHRRGDASPIYASSTKEASWAELFRHTEPGLSPFETRRRLSVLRVSDLRVLDLTDPAMRALLGVTERALVGNRLGVCQRIADFVRQWPEFHGILAPSAAVGGMETLVVFAHAIDRVAVVEDTVESPPIRLVYLFERVVATLPRRLQDPLYDLARETRRAIRRRTGR